MITGALIRLFLTELISNFKQSFYVCGPDLFVSEIHDILLGLGADATNRYY